MTDGLPISQSYNLARLGNAGDVVLFSASDEQRAAIARWADVVSVEKLDVKIDIKKLGPVRFGLDFTLTADVTQACVVTLDPVPAHLEHRFHRELHAATGIWIFLVFMVVSFSGVVIAWPQTMGMNPPGFNPRQMPTVAVQDTRRLGATEAVLAAQAAVPDLKPRTITIPAKPDAPITVGYLSHGAMNAQVLLDPYTGKVLQVRDQSERFLAWMRPVHQGSIGPLWRFLVFLSGLVPLLFVVTGVIMWAKKRKRRIPMTTMTDEVALPDEEDDE